MKNSKIENSPEDNWPHLLFEFRMWQGAHWGWASLQDCIDKDLNIWRIYQNKEIISWYTGFEDKNGIKIFTGDIVETHGGYGMLVVGFLKGRFILTDRWGNLCLKEPFWWESSVKGDRLSTPELLEKC